MKVSIRPHKSLDGWYTLDFRPTGVKGERVRLHIEGLHAAQIRKKELEGQNINQITHPKLKDIYREYLAYVNENQSEKTYDNKVYCFENRIIPHFGNYRVRDLNQQIYDEFGKLYSGKRRAIILYQDYLGALIKWMVKRKYAEPLSFTPEKPKYHLPRHTIHDVLDLDLVIGEVDEKAPARFIKTPEGRIRKLQAIETKKMILTTMLWTGLRWNEVVNLRWEDVNLKRGEILVKESIQEEQSVVRIAPEMAPWFKANRKPKGWVFVNPQTKKPYTTLKTIMKRIGDETGIGVTPHDIRRTSAMMVYESTKGDILAVQKHLRHKDIKTTIRYLECSGARMDTAHQSMIAHIEEKRRAGKKVDKRKTRKSA